MDSTWLPSVGDHYISNTYYDRNLWPEYEKSDTGANRAWSFGEPRNDPSSINKYVSVSGTPCMSQGANLAMGDYLNFSCFKKTASGLHELSEKETVYWGDYYLIESYLKPEAIMVTGLKFRQERWDTSQYYYYYSNNPLDSPERGIHYTYRKYDGYGTLKVGDRIFDSAIRIRKTILSIDSSYNTHNNAYETFRGFSESYDWFVPSIHIAVLTTAKYGPIDKDYFTGTWIDTGWCYISSSYTAKFIEDSGYVASTGDDYTVNFTGEGVKLSSKGKNGGLNYSIYNIIGQQLLTGKVLLSGKGSTYFITFPKVSKGIYILKLMDGDKNSRRIKFCIGG